MARDEENEKPTKGDPAGHKTRIAGDEGSEEAEAAREELSQREAAALAETVLADGDDRTHLVERSDPDPSPDSQKQAASLGPETRVLDPNEVERDMGPSSVGGAAGAAAAVASTRVLDARDDKTMPPPVAEPAAAPIVPTDNAPSDPNPDRGLEPGMVLFGEYEIVSVLGVGGMGEVYRARHRRLDEFRAIKVMHAELSKKEGASEFFYREAKALLAVRHPAVVHCHDLLSDDFGRVYLVMEMIEGIPLSQKMNEGPLSADDVAILGARVSHGLSAAHRKGVIHRDVSPDNIVLPNGRVQEAKIIDFGIAKILEEGEGTILDGFKGKLSYASPEQLGFFGGKLDGRSDFYSLGLVLVAAALGKPMGMGTTVMEAVDARRGFEALPDEIPVGLRSAIAPLLELDPKDRPRYVDRLFVVPGSAEGSEPGGYSNRRVDYSDSKESIGSNRVGLIAAAAIAALALVGGGVWWTTLGGSQGGLEAPAITPGTSASEGPQAALPVAPAEIIEVSPPVEPVVVPVVEPVIAKIPTKPQPRRLTARDKSKMIGLINNAKIALGENRLMSPAGDNAYDRYRQVLELDPKHRQAKDGLTLVAGRYLSLADASIKGGNLAQASEYVANARKADSMHPELAATEERLRN